MGISERKEREKQEMRDLILREATRMFIEDGYEKTSIRNIADRIEYSPATIYLYFKDKDAILYGIHEQGFQILFERFDRLSTIANPYERLHQMCDAYVQFAFDHPEYYDLMFIIRAPMKKLAANEDWDCGFETYHYLRKTVQECLEGGYIREMDVHEAAFFIWTCGHGMVSLAIRERFKMYTEEQVKHLMKASVDMISAALKKE
jgi:AcrR family transcriptional regulator